MPSDLRIPFDPREVIARIVDGSEFDEFKPLYGSSLVTGWARLHGYPLGILANARGILFSEESQKATQFIQLANRSDTPLLFLHNTTGYMVGKDYEERGMIKHGSMMINAVSNSTVPHISLLIGASYGAGITACVGGPTTRGSCSPGPARRPRSWAARSWRASSPSSTALPRKRGVRHSTKTPTLRCGRRSRHRSKRSRCRCSSPGGFTTTA
ncbi:carboxyl transferase domain protein [Mycobacterium xenopi 4042]|uniref:Carboxyl transferase domain protein n=1 Tax=Mycobacterium xenopi 4042 TaxID=1299334 RepID=X8AGR1_MYCXE|nr:carboxyl transferase domain protein [Mycobacterium xenopi 4042]